ncbi:hypothetical protein Q8A73_006470 [Channa argus]|nr:hypothetical protein Q8A73_006470 [Channa argus]
MLTTCFLVEKLSAVRHRGGGGAEQRAQLQLTGDLCVRCSAGQSEPGVKFSHWIPVQFGVWLGDLVFRFGDDVSKPVVKGSSKALCPLWRYLILSLEEHQVTMDGKEVTMATVGLPCTSSLAGVYCIPDLRIRA